MVDLILAKRSGKAHSRQEIDFIIDGVMSNSISDYQLAAWLMAVCWQGMTLAETTDLTDAMTHSGKVLDLSEIGPVVADKHSTGGVGDKTTLVFAPMLSAAGIPMAKLSGRGLGHTGGTLDKLEAIPGFRVDLSTESFVKQVREVGAAIGGQTAELAPADGKIYAMRDVTATVDSLPLIVASILSKKFAAGSNLIILDVKCGRGAIMESDERALELAKMLSAVGERLNKPVTAVVTHMEQPLGFAVGHALEVAEAVETLSGGGPEDLRELCFSLGSLALVKAGKYQSEDSAREALNQVIESGAALEQFRRIIKAQGGDPRIVEQPELMPQARIRHPIAVPGQGKQWIEHIDGREVAEACKLMGAARAGKGDSINLAVGVVLKGKIGWEFEAGQTVAEVHADSQRDCQAAVAKLEQAITYSRTPVAKPDVIRARVG
jgi:pyrimidine-nucleoside phosphorylase